jgi:hypothetical protein
MKHIISSALYLIILLCLSKFIFDPTYLYYEIPWLDIPMHIMGGFGVTSLSLAIATYKKKKMSYTSVLLLYLAVAVGWEVYEFASDTINNMSWNGWPDTLSDIFNGGLGASVAYYLLKK